MRHTHLATWHGQDVERGTFSHRHAVVKVEDSEEEVLLLNQISDQAQDEKRRGLDSSSSPHRGHNC